MSAEQRLRGFLFYLSVCIFFIGLPFIVSFALGYKFDKRLFKFAKTGLIVIKTQPQGAGIYVNDNLLKERTPYTINELLPGRYRVELKMFGYYPYKSDVEVDEGKVARLDKVILFPVRPDIKQLNKERLTSFWLDESKGSIYYVSTENNVIYKSDFEGDHFNKLMNFQPIFPPSKAWKCSPDRGKILYFNWHQIGVICVQPQNEVSYEPVSFVISVPESSIQDVFWYSDSYHLVVVSDTKVEILEAKPNVIPITVFTLLKPNTKSEYDVRSDTLYFLDTQKAADDKFYDNLYKLDLSNNSYLFQEFKRLRPND